MKSDFQTFGTDLRAYFSLDTHDIVFRRKHRDGQKQVVHGEVVLCTQNPTAIKAVKVSLHGVRKVQYEPPSHAFRATRKADRSAAAG